MIVDIRKAWNKHAKENDLPSIEEFTKHMKTTRDVAAWALGTPHREAAEEVKSILFQRFPEIIGD